MKNTHIELDHYHHSRNYNKMKFYLENTCIFFHFFTDISYDAVSILFVSDLELEHNLSRTTNWKNKVIYMSIKQKI